MLPGAEKPRKWLYRSSRAWVGSITNIGQKFKHSFCKWWQRTDRGWRKRTEGSFYSSVDSHSLAHQHWGFWRRPMTLVETSKIHSLVNNGTLTNPFSSLFRGVYSWRTASPPGGMSPNWINVDIRLIVTSSLKLLLTIDLLRKQVSSL